MKTKMQNTNQCSTTAAVWYNGDRIYLPRHPSAGFELASRYEPVRTRETNLQLQALLYTLSTPTQDWTMHFGSDSVWICIDTGTSACISTRRENFIKLQLVENIKINGIETGLPVEGVGTLKWLIRDNNKNKLDITFTMRCTYQVLPWVSSIHSRLPCKHNVQETN